MPRISSIKLPYAVLAVPTMACFLVTSSSANAQCAMAGDVAREFRVSSAVFIGTVLANRPTGEIGYHVMSDIGTLRVERMWKGPQSKTVEVKADAPFVIGKRYLVFAGSSPLSTSIECNWTQLEAASETKLTWLNHR